MFNHVIDQLSSVSMIDIETALANSFDRELFQSFETHKAAGTLEYWFNTQLSSLEKQQLAKYMEAKS